MEDKKQVRFRFSAQGAGALPFTTQVHIEKYFPDVYIMRHLYWNAAIVRKRIEITGRERGTHGKNTGRSVSGSKR